MKSLRSRRLADVLKRTKQYEVMDLNELLESMDRASDSSLIQFIEQEFGADKRKESKEEKMCWLMQAVVRKHCPDLSNTSIRLRRDSSDQQLPEQLLRRAAIGQLESRGSHCDEVCCGRVRAVQKQRQPGESGTRRSTGCAGTERSRSGSTCSIGGTVESTWRRHWRTSTSILRSRSTRKASRASIKCDAGLGSENIDLLRVVIKGLDELPGLLQSRRNILDYHAKLFRVLEGLKGKRNGLHVKDMRTLELTRRLLEEVV
jgi:hypothetical protein